jgi:hypothetical protein
MDDVMRPLPRHIHTARDHPREQFARLCHCQVLDTKTWVS